MRLVVARGWPGVPHPVSPPGASAHLGHITVPNSALSTGEEPPASAWWPCGLAPHSLLRNHAVPPSRPRGDHADVAAATTINEGAHPSGW